MSESPPPSTWGLAPYDDRDLDAVLSGETAGVPEPLLPVAGALAALRAAPARAELAGEAAALAAFREHRAAAPPRAACSIGYRRRARRATRCARGRTHTVTAAARPAGAASAGGRATRRRRGGRLRRLRRRVLRPRRPARGGAGRRRDHGAGAQAGQRRREAAGARRRRDEGPVSDADARPAARRARRPISPADRRSARPTPTCWSRPPPAGARRPWTITGSSASGHRVPTSGTTARRSASRRLPAMVPLARQPLGLVSPGVQLPGRPGRWRSAGRLRRPRVVPQPGWPRLRRGALGRTLAGRSPRFRRHPAALRRPPGGRLAGGFASQPRSASPETIAPHASSKAVRCPPLSS